MVDDLVDVRPNRRATKTRRCGCAGELRDVVRHFPKTAHPPTIGVRVKKRRRWR